jgi:beta-1,4-mannooligosaccharide/beta-1,4-mannosyl-N-acetylglucosamine phosphorylase
MSIKVIGDALGNIPWEERPDGCADAVWRFSRNPIIGRDATPKCARVFNSAVLPYGGGFIGVFRSDHRDGVPQMHLGRSKDAIDWEIEDEEIRWVNEKGEPFQPRYAYDPRLLTVEGAYYIIWCTDFGGAALGLGTTKDFKTFVRLENPFIPFNRNGVLFPRRINGNYVLLSRPSDGGHTPFGDIFVSESPDLVYWGRHRRVMTSGGGWWQNMKIGGGPAPLETDKGWLAFYHGVTNTCNGYVYSMGAALLDIDRPAKVLLRTRDYLLTPQLEYETVGFVPNVCFPCAALCDAETGRIAVYYGAADTYVAVAFTTAEAVYNNLLENSRLLPGDAEEFV